MNDLIKKLKAQFPHLKDDEIIDIIKTVLSVFLEGDDIDGFNIDVKAENITILTKHAIVKYKGNNTEILLDGHDVSGVVDNVSFQLSAGEFPNISMSVVGQNFDDET